MTGTTICALATGQGGAIGVIRVSGPNSVNIADRIFSSPKKHFSLLQVAPYTLHYGDIVDDDKQVVDEVLLAVFRAPHSYTGEDSVEISCHNSLYITQRIQELLISHGCHMAQPGEFTQRAFLNGKMDLSRAEAVADVIASTTQASHSLALNQMRNGFSVEFNNLKDKLLHITSLFELELDFSDHEDLAFADRTELSALLHDLKAHLHRLVHSFQQGNVIKNGLPVALVGDTNVGKSTLLNAILEEDKAIVSHIAGTTRDSIEDTVTISGYLFRFIDTAGIRDTEDTIEKIGIERTFQKISQSQVVVWMVDGIKCTKGEDLLQVSEYISKVVPSGKVVFLVVNKCDEVSDKDRTTIEHSLAKTGYPSMVLSAKTGEGLSCLKEALVSYVRELSGHSEGYIVSNLRHYEALQSALLCVERAEVAMSRQVPSDLIVQDLRECLYHLGEIVGEISSSDIIHNIFSKFCIGK